MFDAWPYSAHLENPTVQDIVNNGINDEETLQKYLLATGILESPIQDSLDMIVVMMENVAMQQFLGNLI